MPSTPSPVVSPDSPVSGAMPALRVDLVSDTSTRPCHAMRQAMAQAPVGDEQLGEDPSVNALTARVADLLGKEAALFLPSGTMANQIALAVHCDRGDAILAARNSHIIEYEGAGAAVFAGAFVMGIDCQDGIFGVEDLETQWRSQRVKTPRSRVVSVEQTSNLGGGSIWPLEVLQDVSRFARAHDLVMHMDGARLMNAVVESGVSARDYAATCDSVWLDLSKGLGCPIGSVLAGSQAFVDQANVWKHRFGGAMRQAGIVAAAGLYALEHNIDPLAHDHRRARTFGAFLKSLDGVRLIHEKIQTNLVFFDVSGTGKRAPDIARSLLDHGVRIGASSDTRMRAVFHRDVDDGGLDLAMKAVSHVLCE
ncbi:threonine aldolase family protein [Orrella marina]|nr:GntG family PLP-dependent aldolase [Orrella marina]